jgi:transcriptional regulator with PAS, ATPase and Fis domain
MLTIKEALFKNKGNINQTAKELGITRKTLYSKIEKYELQ